MIYVFCATRSEVPSAFAVVVFRADCARIALGYLRHVFAKSRPWQVLRAVNRGS